MASPGALIALHEALEAEQAKRAKQRGLLIDEAEARRRWYEELDLMAERMRADPNYREPSPEERALTATLPACANRLGTASRN